MPRHTVRDGDCISSIAEQFGLFWPSVWNHPENAQLKAEREDPNVLKPGDEVFVPEKQLRTCDEPTDQKHTYVRKGTPAVVRLRLLDYKREPRANVHFTAVIDGTHTSGTSDEAGMIVIPAKPNAIEAKLTVVEGTLTEEYTLQLGHIDPIETIQGVQQRLVNLGYDCGGENGTLGEATKAALRAFQKEQELEPTCEADDATRESLKQIHGC